jgi:hypothetical protein
MDLLSLTFQFLDYAAYPRYTKYRNLDKVKLALECMKLIR